MHVYVLEKQVPDIRVTKKKNITSVLGLVIKFFNGYREYKEFNTIVQIKFCH